MLWDRFAARFWRFVSELFPRQEWPTGISWQSWFRYLHRTERLARVRPGLETGGRLTFTKSRCPDCKRWYQHVTPVELARLTAMAEAGAELVKMSKAAVDEEGRRHAYFVGAPELRAAINAYEEASR